MKSADQWFEDHKADKYYSMITFIKDIQRDAINSAAGKCYGFRDNVDMDCNGQDASDCCGSAVEELLEEIKPND